MLKDNKTCKDLGPALKHKLQAQNKKVVEEFDRAKQRMYKRYERALDPNKKASKRDLSYAEYYEWLENAAERRVFLRAVLSYRQFGSGRMALNMHKLEWLLCIIRRIFPLFATLCSAHIVSRIQS